MDSLEYNRRQILKGTGGTLALAALGILNAQDQKEKPPYIIPAKAKRVIYICNSGGPSQLDLYDPKPDLQKWHGKELPESIRGK